MPTSPNGALGSLDYKKEERRVLAIKSRGAAPRFGTPERQILIDEVKCSSLFFSPVHLSVISCAECTLLSQIHEYMLSKAPPVPQLSPSQVSQEQPRIKEAKAEVNLQNPEVLPAGEGIADQAGDRIVEEQEPPINANPNAARVEASTEIPSSVSSNQLLQKSDTRIQNLKPETRVHKPDDRMFTLAAIGLTIAIVVLLLKKFIKSTEHGAVFMNGS